MDRFLPVWVRGSGPLNTPQAENHDLRDGNWQDDCVQVGSNAYVDMYLTDWREIRLTLWSDRFRARFGT
jgi:hypothetical protein